MISLILYVVATIVFAIAFFVDGVHFDQGPDLSYLGLAVFAAAHIPFDLYAGRRG